MRIRVIRSARRTKTVGARLEGDVLVVRAPAHMTDVDLAPIVDKLRERVERHQRRQGAGGDQALMERARSLNSRYFSGKLPLVSVRFVSNQKKRFGSCTVDQGTIRISDRLANAPTWVLDYVLMHELAHLIEPNHSAQFWKLVNRYPRAERARGYLIALGMQDL